MERRLLGGGGVWCEPRLSSKPELSAADARSLVWADGRQQRPGDWILLQDQPSLLLLPATFWLDAPSHFFKA